MSVEKQERIVNIQKKVEFDNVVSSSNLCVVHFWAPWATQCEPMDEAMKILAEDEPDLKNVSFARVEAEEMSDISMDFEVKKLLQKKKNNNIENFELQYHV